MKIAIRRGVFETNSSSMHSITLGTGYYSNNGLKPNSQGILFVSCGDFDWEVESYNDAGTKLSYLLTFLFQHFECQDSAKEKYIGSTGIINPKILQENPTFEKWYNRLEKIVLKQTGAKKLVVKTMLGSNETIGYIDHQSYDVAERIFKLDDIRDFVFSSRSILRTDNDNH